MGKTSSATKWKYNQKAYDRIAVNVPKGDRERYQLHAAAQGETLSGLIKRLLEEDVKRVKGP